jgi:hypothetical protein
MAESSWKDVSIVILGRTIEGVVKVEYDRKTNKEMVFGRGDKPLAIVSGNKEFSGTVTLLQSELQAMVAAVNAVDPTRDLTDVSFDIVVDYDNSNGVATTDLLVGCEITEYQKSLSQGDTHMKIDLPFMFLDLREGVA